MQITQLRINNLRCFEDVTFTPGPGINIVAGDNASGKTTLLEAIYMLGRGQSFRGGSLATVVRRGQNMLTLRTEYKDEQGREHGIGLTRNGGHLQYRLDGNNNTRRLDLVTSLPLQLVDPDGQKLLQGGPGNRRQFLDWGVFHVEQQFYGAWREYRRALRQRNKALRESQASRVITAWDNQLCHAAAIIHQLRTRYCERVRKKMPATLLRVLGNDTPTLSYYPGWSPRQEYADALVEGLDADRRAGYTRVGPHRADIRIDAGGTRARSHVSRGQQKVIAVALLLTQVAVLREERGVSPILLLDDIAAEMGSSYLDAVLNEVSQLGCQCMVTTLDVAQLPGEIVRTQSLFDVGSGRIITSAAQ